jgi:predicted phosphodiesterase
MRTKFPDADLVIFGHSHIPLLAREPSGGTILNPGSATDRRRQPFHSMAEIDVRSGADPTIRFLNLDRPDELLPAECVRSVG